MLTRLRRRSADVRAHPLRQAPRVNDPQRSISESPPRRRPGVNQQGLSHLMDYFMDAYFA